MRIKYLIACIVLLFSVLRLTANESGAARLDLINKNRITKAILGAVRAKVHSYNERLDRDENPVLVSDRAWIRRFAAIIGAGTLEPGLHVFAISSPVEFLDRKGKLILSVEPLPETLRIAGVDYRVTETTLAAIQELIREAIPKSGVTIR